MSGARKLTDEAISEALWPTDEGAYPGAWDRDTTGRIWVATSDANSEPSLDSYSDEEFWKVYIDTSEWDDEPADDSVWEAT